MPSKVPNQREILLNKAKCSSERRYTVNNLDALDGAAASLHSKGGFKLYMYIAKNQDKYRFNLSSSDFMHWSGLSYTAYTTAFQELIDNGYLVQSEECKDNYVFYDDAKRVIDAVVEIPKEKISEIKSIREEFVF